MRNLVFRVVIIVVCVCAPQLTYGEVAVGLLRFDVVKRDLKLSEEQSVLAGNIVSRRDEKLADARKRLGVDGDELKKLKDDDRQARIDQTRRELYEVNEALDHEFGMQVTEVLNSEQIRRLRQLTVQAYVKDLHFLPIPTRLIKQLEITAEQITQLDELLNEQRNRRREGKPVNLDSIRQDRQECLKVFSNEQRDMLKMLQGEPLDFFRPPSP